MKYVLILIILAIFQVPLLIMHTMNPDLSLWFVLSPLWLSVVLFVILAVWFAIKDKKEILKNHNYGKGFEEFCEARKRKMNIQQYRKTK